MWHMYKYRPETFIIHLPSDSFLSCAGLQGAAAWNIVLEKKEEVAIILHERRSIQDELTNYVRRGLILFNNNVARSDWDVEHFQHS